MLNHIKSLIMEKKEFQEAASILMEDATNNVEDLIILNEDGEVEFTEKMKELEEKEKKEKEKKDGKVENKNESVEDDEITEEKDEEEKEDNEDDDFDLDDDSSEEENEDEIEDDEDSFHSSENEEDEEPIEDPELMGGDDDLDDIMHIEIDLATNTVSDVYPKSPKDASSAVNDDSMDVSVDDSPLPDDEKDSSSDEEDEDDDDIELDDVEEDLPSEDEEDNKEEEEKDHRESVTVEGKNSFLENFDNLEFDDEDDTSFFEAIDIGGGGNAQPAATTPTSNEPPPDTANANGDNTVTAAVKDKVGEVVGQQQPATAVADNQDVTFNANDFSDNGEAPAEGEENYDIDYGDSDPNAVAADNAGSGDEDVKSMVIKKLSNITKALEDAKNSVLSHVK